MIEAPEQRHKAFQDAFNRHDLESIVAYTNLARFWSA